jgi:integrase
MASLEKRGQRFRIAFRIGGRKHHISIKTTDPSEANSCLNRLAENLRLVERGRLNIPDGADVGLFLLSDGKLNRPVEVKKVVSLGDMIGHYLVTFTTGAKESNTRKTEGIHFRHVKRVIGVTTPLSDVTNATIQNYVNARIAESYRGKPISPQTIKKELATLRYVWNWSNRQGLAPSRFPATGTVLPKSKVKEPFRTYNQIHDIVDRGGLSKPHERELWDGLYLDANQIAEVLTLIRSTSNEGWLYPLVATAAHTGARRSELLRARIDDFDFKNGIVILREKKRSRLAETFRTVEMTPFLRSTLQEYLKSRQIGGLYAFCESPNRQLTDSVSRKAFRRAVRKTKWNVIRGYHVFRHSFVSAMASAGIDQRVIDEMTGHQTDEMRRRYRHLAPAIQRAALAAVFGV